MTEHRHRTQLPLRGVLLIVAVFLAVLGAGLAFGSGISGLVGLALAFAFLNVVGMLWGYDSTDGRNWRGPLR